MMIQIDREQAEVLREILASSLHELRIESARADSHDFREGLHHREDVVQTILTQLDQNARIPT